MNVECLWWGNIKVFDDRNKVLWDWDNSYLHMDKNSISITKRIGDCSLVFGNPELSFLTRSAIEINAKGFDKNGQYAVKIVGQL